MQCYFTLFRYPYTEFLVLCAITYIHDKHTICNVILPYSESRTRNFQFGELVFLVMIRKFTYYINDFSNSF